MTLADLNVRVSYLNDLKKGLAGIERDLRRASRNFAQAGNEISMSLSLPLGAFFAKAVQTSAQMESLKLAMQTTFRDAGRSIAEADKELEALRKSALAPGLDFEQAVKASIRLQSVGYNAETARNMVEQLANTISMSGGDPATLERVIAQFTQMRAKGKLLQEDLMIIQENMPAVSKLMQEAFGTTNAEKLRDMGVTAEQFIDVITNKMGELPRVSGGLANSITNVGQSIQSFLQQIGDDIAKTFDLKTKFEQFGNWLAGVAEWFKGLSASTKEWILWIGAAVVAIGPLLKIMAGISAMSSQFVSFMGSMVEGLKMMSGKAIEAAKAFQALSVAQKATVIGLAIAAVAAFVLVLNEMSDGLTQAARTQNMLNDVQLQAAQSIAAERLEAERNIAVIQDETKSKDEKKAALDRLIATGSEYFKGLSIEKSSVEQITAATDKYIESLLKAARIKAAEQKLIQLEERKLALLDKQASLQEKSSTRLAAETIFGAMTNTFGQGYQQLAQIQSALDEIDKKQKALASFSASTSMASPMPASASPGSTSTITPTLNSKAAKEQLQPVVTAYRELNKELDMLPQKFDNVTSSMAPTIELSTNVAMVVAQMSTAWEKLGEVVSTSAAAAGQAMVDYAETGGTSLRKMGKEALRAAAQVARAALIGFVSKVIESTGLAAGPLGAIVGPAAGAAAGIAFNAILKGLKVPAFAHGAGPITEPTMAMFGEYPGAKSNPEFALRQDQLQGLLNKAASQTNNGGTSVAITGYRISGADLYLMLEEAGRQMSRRRGY